MVEKTYEFPGGVVKRVSKGKWDVSAPDGRPLGTYPTLKLASEKAQHWDKWDALASLGDICSVFFPYSFLLIVSKLTSLEGVSDKDFEEAITKDALLHVLVGILLPFPEDKRQGVLEKLAESWSKVGLKEKR